MARGDATFSRGNVDWPFDPRCQSLPDNNCRWLHEIMYRMAVKERLPFVPAKYDFEWYAWACRIQHKDIGKYIATLEAKGLICQFERGIIVYGVIENNPKLQWREHNYPEVVDGKEVHHNALYGEDTGNEPAPYRENRDIEKEILRRREGEGEITCAETPEASSPPKPDDPIVLTFPCDGKPNEWHLTESKLQEYCETYRTIDVRQESLKARQWCRDNPGKRKTARGMAAFLTNWFNRAVNRPGIKSEVSARKAPPVHSLPVPPPGLQEPEARKFGEFARQLRDKFPQAQNSTITTMALEKLQNERSNGARARAPADIVGVGGELGKAAQTIAGMMGK